MILNKDQAIAIKDCMMALNNVNGLIKARFADDAKTINIWEIEQNFKEEKTSKIKVVCFKNINYFITDTETYKCQDDFFAAYKV